jgi:hypothetical protein
MLKLAATVDKFQPFMDVLSVSGSLTRRPVIAMQ